MPVDLSKTHHDSIIIKSNLIKLSIALSMLFPARSYAGAPEEWTCIKSTKNSQEPPNPSFIKKAKDKPNTWRLAYAYKIKDIRMNINLNIEYECKQRNVKSMTVFNKQ